MTEELSPVEEELFDIEGIKLTTKLVSVHQEGNWLVAVSENGTRFRQHIPQGKHLVKENGKFLLKDVETVTGSR